MIKNALHLNSHTGCLLALIFLTPGLCQASVFFNEVAWMGDSTSANHEWIELSNDGPATNVDGWILTDGRNLSVELAGTIPAKGYAVLERTSDESAPGAAFFLYTGALHNAGGTLRLENAAGQLVDLVTGGDGWAQIGGDNTTKETAQYTQKGWITAAATPGQQNKSAPAVSADDQTETDENQDGTATAGEQTQTSESKSSNSVQTVRLVLPDVTLDLEIDAQSVGYVHQTIPVRSIASGIGETMLDSLQYQWNFGDGNTADFAEGNHAYAFPGKYVVTLHAGFKRQKQTTRHEITILPVALSLTQNAQGDIQLNNDSPYEVDISGYTVRAKDAFVFPEYSIILPNQTITLPRQRIAKEYPVMVAVYDTHNIPLASLVPVVTPRQKLAQATKAALLSSTQTQTQTTDTAGGNTSPAAATPAPTPASAPVPTANTNASEPPPSPAVEYQVPSQIQITEPPATTPTRTQRLSYVGLAIVILLGIFAVYLTPRRNQLNEK